MHGVVEQEERGVASDVPFPAPVAARPRTQAERRARWVGTGLVALAGVSYAVQSILAKEAYAGGADVRTVLAVRFVVATLTVWAVVCGLRRRGRRVALRYSPSRVLGFGLLGVLFVTNALFGYLALERLPASTTTLLVFVFPALVVLWSRLFFGEPLSRRKAACLALALVGCALVLDPRRRRSRPAPA